MQLAVRWRESAIPFILCKYVHRKNTAACDNHALFTMRTASGCGISDDLGSNGILSVFLLPYRTVGAGGYAKSNEKRSTV